jgi:hypothetical protein
MNAAATVGQRYLVGFVIAASLAVISWSSVSPGMPKIYAPFPLLVVLVLIHTEAILGHGSIIAAAAFIPIVFWLRSLHILKELTTNPSRS